MIVIAMLANGSGLEADREDSNSWRERMVLPP